MLWVRPHSPPARISVTPNRQAQGFRRTPGHVPWFAAASPRTWIRVWLCRGRAPGRAATGCRSVEWADQRWSGLTSGAGRITWSCCGVASTYGRAGWRATAVISIFAPPRRAAPTVVRTGRGSGKCRSYTVLKCWKSDRSARWTRQETTSAGAQPAAPSSAATLPSALSAWSSIVSPVARGRSGRPATPTRRPQDLASTARPAGRWGCDRRLVRHSSSAIFCLRAARAASSRL